MARSEPGLVYAFGLPDDRFARAELDARGRPTMVLPNQLRLPGSRLGDLRNKVSTLWFPSEPGPLPGHVRGVVTMCADAHGYQEALMSMVRWSAKGLPVFNHPRAIFTAQGAETLERVRRIKGLRCPPWIMIRPRRPDDFRTLSEGAGLSYPIRVQETTDRSNRPGAVIKSARGWGRARALDWPGRTYHLSEAAADSGHPHLRYRVGLVGREARIAPFTFSTATGRPGPVEAAARGVSPDHLKAVCGAMLRMIPLDFWSMEVSVPREGELRLEHLWVGLPWAEGAPDDDPSTRLWPQVEPRLEALLSTPQSWRAAQAARRDASA